jgi:hypothetical protein
VIGSYQRRRRLPQSSGHLRRKEELKAWIWAHDGCAANECQQPWQEHHPPQHTLEIVGIGVGFNEFYNNYIYGVEKMISDWVGELSSSLVECIHELCTQSPLRHFSAMRSILILSCKHWSN